MIVHWILALASEVKDFFCICSILTKMFLSTGVLHSQQIGTAQDEVPDEPGAAFKPPGGWGGGGQSQRTGRELHEEEHRTL